jgi:hypothetical protein
VSLSRQAGRADPRRGTVAVALFVAAARASLVAYPAAAIDLPPLGLVPTPAVIEPREAPEHVGEVVVLEAMIESAKAAASRVVLRPVDDGEARVRIVIVPPLVGEHSRRLAERFPGHRVRVVGRMHEFDGEYELFSTDPERVEILDAPRRSEGAAAPTPAVVPTVTLEPPRPVAATPEPKSPLESPRQAPTPTPPVPAPPAAPLEIPSPSLQPARGSPPESCRDARRDWATAATAALAPLDRLASCLSAGTPPCAPELADLRAALAEIAAQEQRVVWLCEESP